MKNLFLSISTVLLAFTAHAQISNAYRTQVESIFQVNRNHVTTGLLQDYGFFYTNVEKFNGVRSDTSYFGSENFFIYRVFLRTFNQGLAK